MLLTYIYSTLLFQNVPYLCHLAKLIICFFKTSPMDDTKTDRQGGTKILGSEIREISATKVRRIHTVVLCASVPLSDRGRQRRLEALPQALEGDRGPVLQGRGPGGGVHGGGGRGHEDAVGPAPKDGLFWGKQERDPFVDLRRRQSLT